MENVILWIFLLAPAENKHNEQNFIHIYILFIYFTITSNYTVQGKSHLKITPTLYRLTFSVVEKSVTFKIAEILAM